MRAPTYVHALVVVGVFSRLRVFASKEELENFRIKKIRQCEKESQRAADAWREAKVVPYRIVQRIRRETKSIK